MPEGAGFDVEVASADGVPVRIHGTTLGEGPPVLLLHGFPQTHVMWHRVARALAGRHTVVATDLRGYGDSGRPPAGEDHSGYAFRAMAEDQVAVMRELGHERFAVVGHDRGARVAHRMALDHPSRVERLALLDILPTAYVYGHVDRRVATAYYHWFFFIQPFDLPERLIAADPAWYLSRLLGGWGPGGGRFFEPDALAEYTRCFADPDVRHAMMEDYRAAASVDLRDDAESEARGVRITAPTLVLWGGAGVVGGGDDDPVEVWRRCAADPGLVRGEALEGLGHFLAEQDPERTAGLLGDFLTGPG